MAPIPDRKFSHWQASAAVVCIANDVTWSPNCGQYQTLNGPCRRLPALLSTVQASLPSHSLLTYRYRYLIDSMKTQFCTFPPPLNPSLELLERYPVPGPRQAPCGYHWTPLKARRLAAKHCTLLETDETSHHSLPATIVSYILDRFSGNGLPKHNT